MNRVIIILSFILFPNLLFSISRDTVRLRHADILQYNDTLYFGIKDSIVLLPMGVDYKLFRNRLVLQNGINSNKKTSKAADYIYKQYLDILNNQIISSTPPGDFTYADSLFTIYDGKIIRNIKYISVDIIDGSVYDTTFQNTTGFGNILEKTHITTRKQVLKQNIKFRKNDIINSRIVSDNERLLRNMPYIEDAKIFVTPVSYISDSVDVYIVTKDNYHIAVNVEVLNYDHFIINPYSVNFLGLGHHLGGKYQYNGKKNPSYGTGAKYKVENIAGTFTRYEINMLKTYNEERLISELHKPFYTTYTRFGGNFTYDNTYAHRNIILNTPDSPYERTDTMKYTIFDTWAGVSFFPFKNPEQIYINTASGYTNKQYFERPYISRDSNYNYHDYQNYLSSVTLRSVQYLNTAKLFGYGIVKDIPVGFNIQFTGGLNQRTYYNRYYFGSIIEASHLLKKTGVFSLKIAGGSFYHNNKSEDAILGARFIYFSPLLEAGSLEIRNNVLVSYVALINSHTNYEIDFNNNIRGLDQLGVYGYSRITGRYQPVVFTPFYWVGFKLSFNPFSDLGWISKSEYFHGNKEFYSAHGISISIKNQSFNAPAVNFQFAYYPPDNINTERYIFKIFLNDFKFINTFSSFKPNVIDVHDFN